jgi:NADPH-dependent ferric siderophore reductase
MLTLPSDALADQRTAHRPYRARVPGIRSISPHFTAVTFTGDDLGTFGSAGFDQQ